MRSLFLLFNGVFELTAFNARFNFIHLFPDNDLAGFDLDRNGERVATIDQLGTCVISNVNSQNSLLTLDLKSPQGNLTLKRVLKNLYVRWFFLLQMEHECWRITSILKVWRQSTQHYGY